MKPPAFRLPPGKRPRPTKEDLEAARDKKIKDVIAPGLDVLFCGINPGLYSGATGHHFARPGNRFWPSLHIGGFTERQLSPYDERELLDVGAGITNLVARTTARADELDPEELKRGAANLRRKVLRYRPRYLAVLGLTSYRIAFGKPGSGVGPQADRIGDTRVWLLPNPSGLNAHYQLPELGKLFAELRRAARHHGPTSRDP
ncbi:MAG: G/U mismatch-specific DNA glycosylase [Actinomycetota bacterium]|nr:G/U mismatch-specific DNA glycosylase [Actinomycetota bacterium]